MDTTELTKHFIKEHYDYVIRRLSTEFPFYTFSDSELELIEHTAVNKYLSSVFNIAAAKGSAPKCDPYSVARAERAAIEKARRIALSNADRDIVVDLIFVLSGVDSEDDDEEPSDECCVDNDKGDNQDKSDSDAVAEKTDDSNNSDKADNVPACPSSLTLSFSFSVSAERHEGACGKFEEALDGVSEKLYGKKFPIKVMYTAFDEDSDEGKSDVTITTELMTDSMPSDDDIREYKEAINKTAQRLLRAEVPVSVYRRREI